MKVNSDRTKITFRRSGITAPLLLLNPPSISLMNSFTPGRVHVDNLKLNYTSEKVFSRCELEASKKERVLNMAEGNLNITILLHRLQAHTLFNATPPIGKIHSINKTAITLNK